jgi:hypothetical protein
VIPSTTTTITAITQDQFIYIYRRRICIYNVLYKGETQSSEPKRIYYRHQRRYDDTLHVE